MRPAFPYRGVMLDLARLMERHDYYFALLPWLRRWGYNVLHLHFTDDQGCGLRFPSHPELATPHAFSPGEMREFCAEARRNRIEIVPEIECWGHTDFITRLPQYRRLREIDQAPGRFSGMCVFEPDARRILADLLRDTAEIFEPRLIHVGLDEVNVGHHPTTKRLLRTRSMARLFGDHIAWCHRAVTALGARMAMWGDHVYKEESLLRRTPKDVVIFDWHYNADYEPTALDKFLDHGFEVWGAPAIQHSRCRIITGPENFENVRRFSAYALQRRRRNRAGGRVTGMVVTVWCPYRYVPGTIEYPLAVCGRLFSEEGDASATAAREFVEEFWGLPPRGPAACDLAIAVGRLHMAAPNRNEYERILFGANLSRPAESFSRFDAHLGLVRLAAVDAALLNLRAGLKRARRNLDRIRDLIAAATFLQAVYEFGANHRRVNPGWGAARKAVQEAWARTRYCDTPAYTGKSLRVPKARGDADAILRHLNRLAEAR